MESKPMKGSLDIMKSCVLNVALLNKNGDLQAPEEIVTTINDDDSDTESSECVFVHDPGAVNFDPSNLM